MKNPYMHGLLEALHEAATFDMENFGKGGLGVALALRYYSGEAWVTVSDLAEELDLSGAQIRRRLDRLMDEGKVERVQGRGTHFYAFTADCADEYARKIEELVGKVRSLQNATGVSYTDSRR